MTPFSLTTTKMTELALSPSSLGSELIAVSAIHELSDALSELCSPSLPDVRKAPVFALIKGLAQRIAYFEKIAKARVLALLVSKGIKRKESLRLELDSYLLEARPHGKGGYDDAKVEALFRAKGHSPEAWMDEIKIYKVNQSMLDEAIEHKILTSDELETCKNEQGWAVQTPKRINQIEALEASHRNEDDDNE